MKRLIGLCCAVVMCIMVDAQIASAQKAINDSVKTKELQMSTRVADHITHKTIKNVKCELLKADSTFIDTTKVESWGDDDWGETFVTFAIKEPGNYLLKCCAEGYVTKFVPVEVKKIYKRELFLELKTVYLKKQPKKTEIELDEVVVKATKLKFYMNGDTLTYDADAFNLAEGSMLDGLLKKMPGVEMNKNGEIKVNGRKVDAMLLNGKDFFNEDRELMIENMPAYMVKNIQAYDRTPRDAAGTIREKNTEKEFVLNVKLKKEYNSGWLMNANAGVGGPMQKSDASDEKTKYMGRLFAMRFDDASRLMLYANANNLNDNRQPGEQNEWTPSEQAKGLQKNYMVGGNYNWTKNEDIDYTVSLNSTYSETLNSQTSNSATYLEGGDTYGKARNASRSYEFNITHSHAYYYWGKMATKWKYFKGVGFSLEPNFSYRRFNRNSNDASVALSDDVAEQLGKNWLDSISAPNAGELLKKYAINRSITSAKGDGHTANANVTTRFSFSPVHNDYLNFEFYGTYSFNETKDKDYNHYLLDYPHSSETLPADFRNRYNNNYARTMNANGSAQMSIYLDKDLHNTVTLGYSYKYAQNVSNRSLYLLNKLESWDNATEHSLGTLPSMEEMLRTLDHDNSSRSNRKTFTNNMQLAYSYFLFNDTAKTMTMLNVSVDMPFAKERLDYHQRGVDTLMIRHTFLPSPSITFHKNNNKTQSGMMLSYSLGATAPNMTNLLNIKNDADPLHITLGNNNLRNTYNHSFMFSNWAKWHKIMYNYGLNATITQNAIASSLIYDKETGVSTTKPENINGNWNGGVNAGIDVTLGKFRIDESTKYTYNHSVDLTGTNAALGVVRSVVNSSYTNEELTVTYEPTDKIELSAIGKLNYQHSSSKREGFEKINAYDFNYGAKATIQLPLDFQIATDLTMYSRRGYSESVMNTNELVWNARVAKKFMHGTLNLQLDGFDILGNLSNVQRTVNAQGRTETFYNVIPSYFLVHVGWKFNQKKKEKKE